MYYFGEHCDFMTIMTIGPVGQKLSRVTGQNMGKLAEQRRNLVAFYSFPYKDTVCHHLHVMIQKIFYL